MEASITHGSIDVAGRRRGYTLAVPPGTAGTGTATGTGTGTGGEAGLILVFHGSNQTGEKFRAFAGHSFDALAGAGGTVVAYLDGYQGHWNDARAASGFTARTENIDDVAFVEAMIGDLAARHRVDRSRVYAVGYSNGGQMVIRLIHQVPTLLAGAAVISASQPAPDNFLLAGAPAVPLPVALIHGTRDRIVPYQGGMLSWWARRAFRVGGMSLSAPDTAAYFAARNGITRPPVATELPHRAESGKTSVTRTDYRQEGAPPVTLYTVHGGGHTVPGPRRAPFILGRTSHDMDAADAIGEFCVRPLPFDPPMPR